MRSLPDEPSGPPPSPEEPAGRPTRVQVASARRPADLREAALVLFAMGPFLRTSSEMSGVPLPYYLAFLMVPGFEQLKQVNRVSFTKLLSIAFSEFMLIFEIMSALLH